MPYTPATDYPEYPTDLIFFQWATQDNPNPRLSQAIDSTQTTIYWTAAPLDNAGSIITGGFLMGIRGESGYTETIYVPAGTVAVDGLSAVGVVRGVRLEGTDYTTGDATLSQSFEQNDKVFCNISGIIQALNASALNGDVGATLKINERFSYLGVDGVFHNRVFATTAARDAAITTPQNGDECYVTADGIFYDYAAGAWTSRDQGTPTPIAAEDEAGKVSIATAAEVVSAASDTDETGAFIMTRLSGLKNVVQNNKYNYIETAGISTAFTATLVPAPTAYATGQEFLIKLHTTSGATPTINFNALGAKNLVDANNEAIPSGALPSGSLAKVGYDGTSFRVLSTNFPKTPVVQTYTDSNTSFGDSTTQFDISNPVGTTFRYTYDGTGTDPGISAVTIPTGTVLDAYIANSSAGNRGRFTVTGSGANYFEVTNAGGVVETNVTIGADGFIDLVSKVIGTWTKPTGLKWVIVEVQAGGGGGGGANNDGDNGGGGGGGGYSREFIAVASLGATETVTLGYGGHSSQIDVPPGLPDGQQGGTSSFGSHLSATGGSGGVGDASSGDGGVGGIGSGGNVNTEGGDGDDGFGSGSTIQKGGIGGSSFYGGGGSGAGVQGTGSAGNNYGGGGGGGSANAVIDIEGGDGAPGVIIVTEYY